MKDTLIESLEKQIKIEARNLEEIEKAFRLPSLPRIPGGSGKPKTPSTGGSGGGSHKYVKKDENFFGPGKHRYWYKMPDGSLKAKGEDGEETATPKRQDVPPEKLTQETEKIKDTTSKLLEEVSGRLETPSEFKVGERKAEETQGQYELRQIGHALDYMKNFSENFVNAPTSSPEAEKMKMAIYNDLVKNIYDQLQSKSTTLKEMGGSAKIKPEVSYENAKSKVKELDSKIIQGQKLSAEEGKEYNKLSRQIQKEDERSNEVLAKQNEKNIAEAAAKKQQEIKDKLQKGEKLYGEKGTYKSKPVEVTPEIKDQDTKTFLAIRYKGMKLDEVKANNKKVINSFAKLNGLQELVDSPIKINSIKGEIKFDFDIKNIKTLEKQLKLAYGKDAPEYFSIDRGSPGGETTINVKKVAGVDWEIKPLPTKNLGNSINDLQKQYKKDQESGKRIEYKFEFAPDQYMSNDASAPGGENFVIFQGDQRSGKGASFGTMMNQAIGSADGNIVQFHNFDPTGAFWADMTSANPDIVKQMEEKGLLATNAVVKDSIKSMDPKTQAKAVGEYVNQFVDAYNSEYIKRDALLKATLDKDTGKPGVSNVNKVTDQQVPQSVFNFDEIQQFEDMIINNPEIEDGDRKAMLQKMAGVLSTQKTNGKKRGITLNIGVQQGFQSEELRRVAKSPNNTLVSLDGKADVGSFGRVRGFQNAINTAAIGSAVKLTTGVPDQLPKTNAPILPGSGTAKQLAGR